MRDMNEPNESNATAPANPAPTPPQNPKRRRWLRWGIELLIFIVAIAGIRAYLQRDVIRGAAPAIAATTLDGTRFELGAGGGRPTLVHFWASWCPVCRAEEGNIENIARDYRVIAVAMQSGDANEVRAHVQKQDWQVPVIVDTDGTLARQYGVRGVPTSFVVDARGNIRTVEVGYTTEWGLRLRLWWAGRSKPD